MTEFFGCVQYHCSVLMLQKPAAGFDDRNTSRQVRSPGEEHAQSRPVMGSRARKTHKNSARALGTNISEARNSRHACPLPNSPMWFVKAESNDIIWALRSVIYLVGSDKSYFSWEGEKPALVT